MNVKLVVAAAILLVSIPSLAQVQPQATAGKKFPLQFSVGGGMDYFSGDWGIAEIKRWGPAAWGTLSLKHCIGITAEGHSMILGGNDDRREAPEWRQAAAAPLIGLFTVEPLGVA